jgi:3-dehydroquinate dehydratase/shikimate dehydrogenase
MICVSIAQTSRRLALADMLNAATMGADLLEVRLDTFEHEPDPKELLSARRKPVIFSCRRKEDGGSWRGSEDARIVLLKTAIIAQPDYCELEYDVADQIRRFGPCQRVISYTNLKETPKNIAEIYEEAKKKDPDIIKLTCRARTPEEAWPLVQILAKSTVPTVVVGLGRPGLMLTILGRKIGAPFALAALELGLEAYPGQPTISELERVYDYRNIHRQTPLLGVTGLGTWSTSMAAVLNRAFQQLSQPTRCLPLQVGNVRLFRKIIEAVKLVGVVVDAENQETLRDVAGEVDGSVGDASVDLLVQDQAKQWVGIHTLGPAAGAALESEMQLAGRPLQQAMVVIAGVTPIARGVARDLAKRGAKLIFASADRNEAARMCQAVGGRQIQPEAIYTTLHDAVVVSREKSDPAFERPALQSNYLRPGMVVLDLTDLGTETDFVRDARLRGARVVSGKRFVLEHAISVVERLTGKKMTRDALESECDGLFEEE